MPPFDSQEELLLLLPSTQYLSVPVDSGQCVYGFRSLFSACQCRLWEGGLHDLLVETDPQSLVMSVRPSRPFATWLPTVSPVYSPLLTPAPNGQSAHRAMLSSLRALPQLCAWNDALPHPPFSTPRDHTVPPHPANLAQPSPLKELVSHLLIPPQH